ncbi:MAG: P-loop NTPase [Candidatus Omnitrophica bacterium]|nr:P-loop NTPase [Candidatus Omnitrophota bacterium]
MITIQKVRNALSTVPHPRDPDKNLVTSGYVRNIQISDNAVSFQLIDPNDNSCINTAKEVVQKLDGVKSVEVKVIASPLAGGSLEKVKSIIAISSCKGGVGKSTVAAHIAREMAKGGYKVGLVDADIHGPSVPALFNLKNVHIKTNNQKQLIPVERDGLKIMSFGFLLGDAPAVMRGPIVTRYIQQILMMTDWGELDYLFIDMPPGTGDVQLTITQTARLSGAVIVTTPQTLSLLDVARGILMFEKVNVPIIGIIENMSYFLCNKCDEKHYIFGENAVHSLQKRFGVKLLAEIPLQPQMTLSLDQHFSNDYIMLAVEHMKEALSHLDELKSGVPDVKFDKQNISVQWADGMGVTVSNKQLRLSCRCALCANEITGEVLISEDDIRQDIQPKEITPLGNYALGIVWNDGHSSGIYPYTLIKDLANTS